MNALDRVALGQLVPTPYFDAVSRLMKRYGLREFARVVIDTSDVRYHVPAGAARSTTLFFSLSQRAFIVQMEYNESDHEDEWERQYPSGKPPQGVTGYWGVRFYQEFLPYKNLLDRVKHLDPDCWDRELEKVPFHGYCPEFSGFQNYGNQKYGAPGQNPEGLNLLQLVKEISEVVYATADWLAGPRFEGLQVTDFPPHYTFPGSENIFWDRFGRHNLRPLIRKAWGSKGLKR